MTTNSGRGHACVECRSARKRCEMSKKANLCRRCCECYPPCPLQTATSTHPTQLNEDSPAYLMVPFARGRPRVGFRKPPQQENKTCSPLCIWNTRSAEVKLVQAASKLSVLSSSENVNDSSIACYALLPAHSRSLPGPRAPMYNKFVCQASTRLALLGKLERTMMTFNRLVYGPVFVSLLP